MRESKRQSDGNLFTTLVFLSLLLTFMTVVLSAYIRLSIAGVGCSVWPDCYGVVINTDKHQGVAVLTEIGTEMPHSFARTTHRIVASLLGLFIVGISLSAWRNRRSLHTGMTIPLLLLATTIFLSILGYLTPSPLIPAVTVANLIGGMAMLAMLWWLGQRSVIQIHEHNPGHDSKLKRLIVIGLILVCLQITLGGWTSANYAAADCPDLIGCGQPWSITELMSGLNPLRELTSTDSGKVLRDPAMAAIHMLHRFGAVILILYLFWMAALIMKTHIRLRSDSITILVLVSLQAGIGVLSIYTHTSLAIVTLHNMVAALLLLAVTNLLHRATPTR